MTEKITKLQRWLDLIAFLIGRRFPVTIDEIREENGGLGLLFDIHGTGGIEGTPADLYLGTVNGCTVARLLRADPQAQQPTVPAVPAGIPASAL